MECRICLIPDPGNHYKESCCRACAAFFRRTIQMKLRYKCKRFKDCKLTKDNRFSCRYCRMKRCIEAGMTSAEDPEDTLEAYLDDSNPALPEIGLMQSSSTQSLTSILAVDVLFSEENVFNNHGIFSKQYQAKIDEVLSKVSVSTQLPFKLSLYQQGSLAYERHSQKWPNCTKKKMFVNNVIDVASFYCIHLKEVLYVSEFCMEFSEFSRLPIKQKMLIQSQYVPRFNQLDNIYMTIQLLGSDIGNTRVVFYNGQVVDILKLRADTSKVSESKEQELIQSLFVEEMAFASNYANELKKLNPDHFEFVYMLLYTLWNVKGIAGISTETQEIADEVQERLLEELMYYYKFDKKLSNYASRIYKIQNIFTTLEKINGIRKEAAQVVKTFDMYKFDIYLNETLRVSN